MSILKIIEKSISVSVIMVFRHSVISLVLILLIALGIASQLPKIKQDNSYDVFFPTNDPDRLLYDSFRDQFGSDQIIAIIITPDSVFDNNFLNKLKKFHNALENKVPHVKDIVSLFNVRDVRTEKNKLVVENLIENIPNTPRDMKSLKERIMKSDLYRNYVISEDGQATLVLIEPETSSAAVNTANSDSFFDSNNDTLIQSASSKSIPISEKELGKMIRSIEKIVKKYDKPSFPIHFSGEVVMDDYLNTELAKDVSKYILYTFLIMIVLMVSFYRSLSAPFMSIIVVILSLVCTFSVMAFFETPFTVVTSILPSLLISVGIGTCTHVLMIYLGRIKQYGDDKETAIRVAYEHSGLPILFTSLTTAIGLLSFCSSNISVVADLGLYGAVGILFVLVFTYLLLPAMIAMTPEFDRKRAGKTKDIVIIDRMMNKIAMVTTKKAGTIATLSAVIFAVSSIGLIWQGFGHNYFEYYPRNSKVYKANDILDSKTKGIVYLEFIIDSGKENGLYEPSIMNKIEELSEFISKYRNEEGYAIVGKTSSIVDILKETHRALNDNDPRYYIVPDKREIIAQELLLFESQGRNDVEKLVDSQFSLARLSVKVKKNDASEYIDFVNTAEKKAVQIFGDSAKIKVTGSIRLFTKTIDMMMVSMARSYIIAGIGITILLIIIIGDIRLGLISMIPNIMPIAMTLGIMGWLGVKLDMANILIGSIALGIAVDDTVHFFYNYRKYYEKKKSVLDAVAITLRTTGKAMVFTTVILVSAFWIRILSPFPNIVNFGLITGITLVVALLADIIVVPAMFEIMVRLGIKWFDKPIRVGITKET